MKAISIITIIYGGLGAIWSFFGLMIISLENTIFRFIPQQDFQDIPFNITDLIGKVHQLYLIFMPLMMLIAVFYLISGIRLLNQNRNAIILIRMAAILNILWYIGYAISILNFSRVFFPDFQPQATELIHRIMIVGTVFSAVFFCGYPVFLLVYFSLKKS